VPIQLIHERWIRKFQERQASAPTNLKQLHEKEEVCPRPCSRSSPTASRS
jgi:hypothetical protein